MTQAADNDIRILDSTMLNTGNLIGIQQQLIHQKQKHKASVTSTFSQKHLSNDSVTTVLQMMQIQQLDQEYLRYCSIYKIRRKLHFYLPLLQLVTDLYQSIKRHNCLSRAHIKQQVQPQANNDQFFRQLILNDMFQCDIKDLGRVKYVLEQKLSKLLSLLRKRINDDRQFQQFCQKLDQQTRITYEPQKNLFQNQQQQQVPQQIQQQMQQQLQQQYYLITLQNYQLYIKTIHEFLIQKYAEFSLFRVMKNITYKWICCHHVQQIKRTSNLLGINAQYQNQTSQGGVYMKKATQKDNTQQIASKLNKLCSSQNNQNQNYPQQLFLQVIQRKRSAIQIQRFIRLSNLKDVDYNKLCCVNFMYDFSSLQSNRYRQNKYLDNVIVLQDQSQFIRYQNPVRQAAAALLNDQGGYIFLGYTKVGQFYKPYCAEKLTQNSVQMRKNQITRWLKTTFPKLYKFYTVDYIPIAQGSTYITNDNNWSLKYQKAGGQYLCRITIKQNSFTSLIMHSVGDKFYEIDKKGERCIQIIGNQENKDLVYERLKQLTENFGIVRNDMKKIQYYTNKFNHTKLVQHEGECVKIQIGAFAKSLGQFNVKKNYITEIISMTPSKGQNNQKRQNYNTQSITSSLSYNQSQLRQQDELKHINLIVLQSKAIKGDCEKYLNKMKVAFIIQKLDTSLKKLQKQTFVIKHLKKYEQINLILNNFKKQNNSNKKVILISAQRSVCVDKVLKDQQLLKVRETFKKQYKVKMNEKLEKLQLIQDTKDGKSYIRAQTKLGGIYLYYILTQHNIKSKMKNVPVNLQNNGHSLDQILDRQKQITQKYKNQPQSNEHNNDNYRNGYNNKYCNNSYNGNNHYKYDQKYNSSFDNNLYAYNNGENNHIYDPNLPGWISYFQNLYLEAYGNCEPCQMIDEAFQQSVKGSQYRNDFEACASKLGNLFFRPYNNQQYYYAQNTNINHTATQTPHNQQTTPSHSSYNYRVNNQQNSSVNAYQNKNEKTFYEQSDNPKNKAKFNNNFGSSYKYYR